MSMKSGGSESTLNFSGTGCLVGSTVDFGVAVGGGEVAERVFDIRRATDSNRRVLGRLIELKTHWEWEAGRGLGVIL